MSGYKRLWLHGVLFGLDMEQPILETVKRRHVLKYILFEILLYQGFAPGHHADMYRASSISLENKTATRMSHCSPWSLFAASKT